MKVVVDRGEDIRLQEAWGTYEGSRGRGQRSRGPRAFFYQTRENQVQRWQHTCKSNTASRPSPTIRKKAEQNGMRITQSIYCNMGMENNCTDDATNNDSKNISKEVRSAKASTQDTVFHCLKRNRRAARVLWENCAQWGYAHDVVTHTYDDSG
jgi:hypothetical protein